MYEVRVEADFSAAHFLRDYNGKCENLHGHNYKVYAYVKGEILNEGGMLLDFTFLKGALREVCKTLDHTNLNDIEEFDQNPSAERISFYIYREICRLLKEKKVDISYEKGKKTAYLSAVSVFETETSKATYSVE